MDLFRVRLNCIDHYQSVPTSFDPLLRSNVHLSQIHKEPKVPVIRVFGATETGQKVCAHIHGAFPYLYIEYNGSLVQDEGGLFSVSISLCRLTDSQLVFTFIASICQSISPLPLATGGTCTMATLSSLRVSRWSKVSRSMVFMLDTDTT
jgi:hypothetical protein